MSARLWPITHGHSPLAALTWVSAGFPPGVPPQRSTSTLRQHQQQTAAAFRCPRALGWVTTFVALSAFLVSSMFSARDFPWIKSELAVLMCGWLTIDDPPLYCQEFYILHVFFVKKVQIWTSSVGKLVGVWMIVVGYFTFWLTCVEIAIFGWCPNHNGTYFMLFSLLQNSLFVKLRDPFAIKRKFSSCSR